MPPPPSSKDSSDSDALWDLRKRVGRLEVEIGDVKDKLDLLIKIAARQQDQTTKLLRIRAGIQHTAAVTIQRLREKLVAKTNYIKELEMFAKLPPSDI